MFITSVNITNCIGSGLDSLPRHHIKTRGFSKPLVLFYLGVIVLKFIQLRLFYYLRDGWNRRMYFYKYCSLKG